MPDKDARTALHVAAFRATEPFVKMLIEKGADPYATDKCGFTPSILAEKSGKREMKAHIEALCEKLEEKLK